MITALEGKMKSIYYMITFVIFLAACAPAPTTLQSPVVSTSVPPSPTTAPTVEPSPTVDSNMPEAPAGVTVQKDAQGYYFDKDGVRYRDTTLTDSLGQERYRGWFSNHVTGGDLLNGGIPLLDQNQYSAAGMPMWFYGQVDLMLPYISHVPNPNETGKSLSGAVYNGLHDIRFNKLSLAEMYQAYQGGLTIQFTTPDGKAYIWKASPSIGVEFYAIPWDAADPVAHPEFFQTPEAKQFGNAVYRWTVFTKSDGTLVILSAVQDSDALNDTENAERFVNPIGVVIEHKKLSATDLNDGWALGGYPSDYVSGVIPKWRGLSLPYFNYQDNP